MLPNSVASLLSETLLERLLQLLHDALSVATYQIAIHLVCRSFEAILEASLHNPDFWSAFKSRLNSNMLLKELLLENSTAVVRKNVTKQIMTKCTFSPRWVLEPKACNLWPDIHQSCPSLDDRVCSGILASGSYFNPTNCSPSSQLWRDFPIISRVV
jgi:hypothetical protein